VINLVTNAIDALEECEVDRPEIRVTMGENLAGTEVWVRIADNGTGIDLDSRDRIFDPFYTSRENGTGLGLAMCRKIVDKHHGTIEVVSPPIQQADPNEAGTHEAHTQEAEGTEFVMTFPRRRGMGTEGG
jgi:signal transduction histidine kinase